MAQEDIKTAHLLDNPILLREAGEGTSKGVDADLLGTIICRELLLDDAIDRGIHFPAVGEPIYHEYMRLVRQIEAIKEERDNPQTPLSDRGK